MRVITVDNGNTNPHVGIFEKGKLSSIIPLNEFSPLPDDSIIASDVGAPLSLKLSFNLKEKRHTKGHPAFFEMPVHYSETLGDDRLIAGYYIFKKLNPNESALVIDAGTFITIDVVSSKGFEGGYIFPGVRTFLSSYGKGAHLPVLSENQKVKMEELPHSTEEAILGAKDIYLSSILKGIVTQTMPSKIFITGGTGELIELKMKELNLKVPLERDPHLIHSALFLIHQALLHQA